LGGGMGKDKLRQEDADISVSEACVGFACLYLSKTAMLRVL